MECRNNWSCQRIRTGNFSNSVIDGTVTNSLCGGAKRLFLKCFTASKKFYPGFTLLEVMVSLAILATAFAAVLRLHSDSMEMLISSRVHTRAAELAQYKMTEIESLGLKNFSFMSGDFGDLAPEYTWDISTEQMPIASWAKVTVIVRNRNMGKGGEFELIEYMLTNPEKKYS